MEHRARKRFGQHFLHDPNIICNIVAAIAPVKGDRMIEIGPGLGAITLPLLEKLGQLDVIELDRDVIPTLQQACCNIGELTVHEIDALKFDIRSLSHGQHDLRIVGNLPYNISTPLIFHLLESAAMIKDMHFLLQKEVVERLSASPGTKRYGRLSVMVQFYCSTQHLFNVGANAFKPPPRVESALVRLVPHASPPAQVNDPRQLAQLVNQAFSQRRKTLRNALKTLLDATQIEHAGIDPGLRPEMLSVGDFAALANQLPPTEEQ